MMNNTENNTTSSRTVLAIIGLVLALPFPILVVVLWVTLNGIKGQGEPLGEGTMNAVVLYLLQFFVVPLLSISSIIIGAIATMSAESVTKRIGYISLAITVAGFVILGLFLNNS